MKSIAIWCEPPLPDDRNNELHINYWELPSNKIKWLNLLRINSNVVEWWKRDGDLVTFIDFGLKINKLPPKGVINFLFPFQFEAGSIIPLNSACCDVNVACAIFNENYSVDNSAVGKFHKFELAGLQKFYFYAFEVSNMEVSPTKRDPNVTKLQIKFPDEFPEDDADIYIRFRLLTGKIQGLNASESLSNAPFQRVISGIETIDFRINDLRDIGRELNEETKASKSFYKFKKLHFFFMCSSQRELKLSNCEWVNCRYLEKNVWNAYLEGIKHSAQHILAYHWKCTPEEGTHSFTLLIKSLVERVDWIRLACYAILSLSLTIALGYFSNYTYEGIKNEGGIKKATQSLCHKISRPICNLFTAPSQPNEDRASKYSETNSPSEPLPK